MVNASAFSRALPVLVPRLAPGVTTCRSASGALRLYSAPFPRRWIHRLLARWMHLPERIELELDDLGAWVVERLDGRDLDLLAAELAVYLKLTQREAAVALGDFLRQLVARQLASIHADTERLT